MRAGPACRRMGGRHELGGDFGRGSESGIVEDGQVLVDRSACRLWRKSLVAFNPLLPVGVGLDEARIDGKSFTSDQPLLNTALEDILEYATKEIALAEAAMSVLGMSNDPAPPRPGRAGRTSGRLD